MNRIAKASLAVLFVSVGLLLFSEERAAARTAWCESTWVGRVGRNFLGDIVTGTTWAHWGWHGGGRGTAEQCVEVERGSAVFCGTWCESQGAETAEHVCINNPGIYAVSSLIEQVKFDGQVVYYNAGGYALCCQNFGRNCGG